MKDPITPGDFSEFMAGQDFASTARRIAGAPEDAEEIRARVRGVLARAEQDVEPGPEDLAALLSPAADACLEEMAVTAQRITRKRFGRTVQMYAPMYLSNHCSSTCTYCGFSFGNKDVRRLTLTPEQAVAEADLLHERGIRHILLLTGEAYKETPVEYLEEVCARLAPKFPSISIEVYPLLEDDYRRLRESGVDGLAVYQETYDPLRYSELHLGGMKKRMNFRLDCPDRGGRAGLRRIALGALLGLSDPAADAYFVALHARHVLKRYWRTQVSLSLPRLRPASGVGELPVVGDREYARYLFALRIFLHDAGLNLSTREPAHLRDHLAELCITHMSAGSKTEPGGYSGAESTEQFEIEDRRSVAEIRAMLESRDLEPVFTDWSQVLK